MNKVYYDGGIFHAILNIQDEGINISEGNYFLGDADCEVDVHFLEPKEYERKLDTYEYNFLNNLIKNWANRFSCSSNERKAVEKDTLENILNYTYDKQYQQLLSKCLKNEGVFFRLFDSIIFCMFNDNIWKSYLGPHSIILLNEGDNRCIMSLLAYIIGLKKGYTLMHGCGIVDYNNEAWIFTGPSGAGKSTICKLIRELRVLNDELLYVQIKENDCFCSATPWSYSPDWHNIANNWYPIKYVCLLDKKETVSIEILKKSEGVSFIYHSLYARGYMVMTNSREPACIMPATFKTASMILNSCELKKVAFAINSDVQCLFES